MSEDHREITSIIGLFLFVISVMIIFVGIIKIGDKTKEK